MCITECVSSEGLASKPQLGGWQHTWGRGKVAPASGMVWIFLAWSEESLSELNVICEVKHLPIFLVPGAD
jgi:hypothetical protein